MGVSGGRESHGVHTVYELVEEDFFKGAGGKHIKQFIPLYTSGHTLKKAVASS